MLTKELLEQLNAYVKQNLRERHPKPPRDGFDIQFEQELYLPRKIVCECRIEFKVLDGRLAKADEETFAEYLLRYMNERGADPVEVYKRAHLNRRFLSKLRTNRKYKPHKHTLIAIAFGLELSLDEAEDLLDRAGYSFSPYDAEDVIAKFFFEQGVHDLFEVNEALDRYGCKILGG